MLVVHLFEDAIATYDYEVVVVFDLECTDLGGRNDDVGVAAIAFIFRLNITNGARDGEAPWEDAVRPDQSLCSCCVTR